MVNRLVSFIISAYNAEDTIVECIQSVFNQTYNNWELIIINDCSEDNTLNLLIPFLNDSRVKLISNEKNIGLTKSLNIGIKLTNGDYIARLDADDIALPSRIEKQVKYLESHPDVVIVGTGAYLINSSKIIIGRVNVVSTDFWIKRLIPYVNLFSHSTWLVRKRVLNEVGSYREEFRYSQDYDLLLRISENSKLSNIPEPLQMWRISEKCITMKHNTLQRVYADIAKEFAKEREKIGYDKYQSTDFASKIDIIMEKNKKNYLCETGLFNIILNKNYKSGSMELIKGFTKGGFPSNVFYKGLTQLISKLEKYTVSLVK